MEKVKIGAIIVTLLICINCSENKTFNSDTNLRIVLNVNQYTDCSSCIETALKMLSSISQTDENIYIIMQKDSRGYFKKFVHKNLTNNNILFTENKKIRHPHPSIIIFKGNTPLFLFYIPNDKVLLNKLKKTVIKIMKQSEA
jgi:hypothetical protein